MVVEEWGNPSYRSIVTGNLKSEDCSAKIREGKGGEGGFRILVGSGKCSALGLSVRGKRLANRLKVGIALKNSGKKRTHTPESIWDGITFGIVTWGKGNKRHVRGYIHSTRGEEGPQGGDLFYLIRMVTHHGSRPFKKREFPAHTFAYWNGVEEK